MDQAYAPTHLAASQQGRAAAVLAKAFRDDPMTRYLVPDDGQRVRLLPWVFGGAVRYALRYGEVYTTPDLAGVACWLPPGNTTVTTGRMLRGGMTVAPPRVWPAGLRFGLTGSRRLGAMTAYMDGVHQRRAPGPHW